MKLNKKQKLFLFTEMLSDSDKIKIFETNDLDWLCSQKCEIKNEDAYGWQELWCDGEMVTKLNFATYGVQWNEVLLNIDEYERCQWCEQWEIRDEIVFRKRGFTRLCRNCNTYLLSREGEI